MLHYIENLRNKPEHVRRRVVFFSSLGIIIVIIAIWAVMLVLRIKATDFSFKKGDANTPSIGDTFSSFFNGIKGVVDNTGGLYTAPTTSSDAQEFENAFKQI